MIRWRAVHATVAALAMTAGLARASEVLPPAPVVRQPLEDAWWTGPMLANTAAIAAPGHFLIEPYVFDVIGVGGYDRAGVRRAAPRADGFGSLTYVVYGLADRVAVGMIPSAGFNTVRGGPSSAGPGLTDTSLLAQYGLTRFHEGSWLPATAVNVQETLPTGRYDRLGNRPSDGFGSGAFTTTLSFYSQTYLWLPNGRILRMRLDVSQAFSSSAHVEDASVYGTAAGFRGSARPGSSLFVDAACEYSLTRSWVLASDVFYRHGGNTRVNGTDLPDANGVQNAPRIQVDSGSSDAFGLAPAIEYNWRPDLGVLLGVRVIAAGRNTAVTITPAVAINYVR
ncbi:MAG TPA: transporter [Thermoanaerobaculia bacterium]|nr:transporter [Thermoanaerobaculia bacterium]